MGPAVPPGWTPIFPKHLSQKYETATMRYTVRGGGWGFCDFLPLSTRSPPLSKHLSTNKRKRHVNSPAPRPLKIS